LPAVRLILYMVLAVIAISIVRSVIGVLAKAFGDFVAPQRRTAGAKRENIPLSGELKKDPVCGTYTSAATAITKTVGKDTLYFCSTECRDRYVAKASEK